ncbi:uncharacterized protein TrAFT101_007213 [Trichoderma asperellum]|uniref:uncharacterized protein n=1 Tax=Trichoderma asperellum TaxID=101201 RepID=UPI003333787F|nr:hypothetical protein TrAFT101_007213 [Trichoderma asperellum]
MENDREPAPLLFSWPKARCRNGAGHRDSLFPIQTARQDAGSLYGVVRGLKEYEAPFSLMLLVRKNWTYLMPRGRMA